jgi:hypothetical protein
MSCACVYVRARALVHARECVHSACRALGQYEYGEGILKRTCKPAGAEMCCVIRSRVHPHTHHESDPCPTLPRAHSATLSQSLALALPAPTQSGENTTPSWVTYLSKDSRRVGKAAERAAVKYISGTVYHSKRVSAPSALPTLNPKPEPRNPKPETLKWTITCGCYRCLLLFFFSGVSVWHGGLLFF